MMPTASFHAESLLRAQHEAFAHCESARRAAKVQKDRGIGGMVPKPEIQWIPWGSTAEIVGVFDRVETEYSAIRSGAALCDQPQRGTIEVTGAQRIAFLQSMCTQDLNGLAAGQSRRSFLLNRKGRIDADLLLCELGDRLLIDCAGASAESTAKALTKFVFSEEVTLTDVSSRDYRMALHGPEALHLLALTGASEQAVECLGQAGSCLATTIAGVLCVLVRADVCGTTGIEIFVARDQAIALWSALLGVHDLLDGGKRRARPCGWQAFNIARIEGGSPLFEIDFSTTSLPHETGILAKRVSFKKGCYLGQEIVARMESLGKPKQMLCAFRMESNALPNSGAQMFAPTAEGGTSDAVGVVTSSAMSPMLGATCIGFASIRYAFTAAETALLVSAEGLPARAIVQAELGSLPEAPSSKDRPQ